MSRAGRKKVFEWQFTSRGGVTMKVPVHLLHRSLPQEFEVRLPDYGVEVRNTDINALRDEVFKELEGKLTVTWAPFLYVRVQGSAHPSDGDLEDRYRMEADVDLDVKPMEIGTRNDGSKCHREGLGQRIHDGMPDVGKDDKERWDSRRAMRAVVPDTPANRAALDELARRFQALLDALDRILSPEQIDNTLESVTAGWMPLLPPPAPTDE